jgi:hypothetical protein
LLAAALPVLGAVPARAEDGAAAADAAAAGAAAGAAFGS